MLIICCGMSRSGSTLHYQITNEILSRKKYCNPIGNIELNEYEKILKSLDENKNHCSVIKLHNFNSNISLLLQRTSIKFIYSYRDIRDVAVSLMNKNNITFAHVLPSLNRCLLNFYHWINMDSILISRYEDFIDNLHNEVKRIANFLEIKLTNLEIEEIAKLYSLNENKNRISEFNYNERGIRINNNNVYNPSNLLHKNHINSGLKMQWKKKFSDYELSVIEKLSHKWLKDNGYSLSQNHFNIFIIGNIYYSLIMLNNNIKSLHNSLY